jgi:hypothetical protein
MISSVEQAYKRCSGLKGKVPALLEREQEASFKKATGQ